MRPFTELIEGLEQRKAGEDKITLLVDYFQRTPDPDRGWAVAAMTGQHTLKLLTPARLRKLIEAQTDPFLLEVSQAYLGDLTETAADLWPGPEQRVDDAAGLSDAVADFSAISSAGLPPVLQTWMARLTPACRYTLLKLLLGGIRVCVTPRQVKQALARIGGHPLAKIEEMWFGLAPPYTELFDWLEGHADPPVLQSALLFRPFMPIETISQAAVTAFDPSLFHAEETYGGLRVQLSAQGGKARMFTEEGTEISQAFPDIVEGVSFDAVLDCELLIVRDGVVQPYDQIRNRLKRKRVSPQLLAESPAHLKAHDILFDGAWDRRHAPFSQRRNDLEKVVSSQDHSWIDLIKLEVFSDWDVLISARDRVGGCDLLLKHRDSPYQAGAPCYLWKRPAHRAVLVAIYAEHGAGRRSGPLAKITLGCWWTPPDGMVELVPVGHLSSADLPESARVQLAAWVAENTTDRFGPVRALRPGLVLDITYECAEPSPRRKAGLVLQSPVFIDILEGQKAEEAAWLSDLKPGS